MTQALTLPTLGSQEPRLSYIPPYFTTLGDDAVDLAELVGIELLDWEAQDLRDAMGRTNDGRWSAPIHLLLACRQNGKNVILEVRELAGLFLLKERKIVHTAHEFKTAKDAFMSLTARIAMVEDFEDLCLLPHRTSNEEVSVRTRAGQFIRYVARTPRSLRGFREVDLLVADEAFSLTEDDMASMRPTQSASRNRQFWVQSSAGTTASEILAKLRAAGISKTNARLLFKEWSCAPDIDIADRMQWFIANPSLGTEFCTLEFLEEQFDLLGEIAFAREHLGIWDDPRVQAVITPDQWNDCKDEDSEVVDPIAVAVDVTPDQSFASIAIAGRRADGLPYGELVANDRGTAWVVEAAARLALEFDALTVVLDGSGPAGALISAFAELGVEVYVTGPRDMAQACGALYAEVMSGQWRHNGEPKLAAAVSASRKRNVGDAWAWARSDTTADISPLVAVTLAWHGYSRRVTEHTTKKQRTGKVW